MTTVEWIIKASSKSTYLVGWDDSDKISDQESLCVTFYDRATKATLAGGMHKPISEVVITTNKLVRSERHSDRCAFLPFVPWTHDTPLEDTGEAKRGIQ